MCFAAALLGSRRHSNSLQVVMPFTLCSSSSAVAYLLCYGSSSSSYRNSCWLTVMPLALLMEQLRRQFRPAAHDELVPSAMFPMRASAAAIHTQRSLKQGAIMKCASSRSALALSRRASTVVAPCVIARASRAETAVSL